MVPPAFSSIDIYELSPLSRRLLSQLQLKSATVLQYSKFMTPFILSVCNIDTLWTSRSSY